MAKPPHSGTVERRLRRWLWLRVTLPIVAAGMLLLAIGGYSAWRVYRLHARGLEILNVNVANIRAADEVVMQSERIRYLVQQGAVTFDARYPTRAGELLDGLELSTKRLARLANSDEERQIAESVERGRSACMSALADLDPGRMYSTVAERLEHIAEQLLPNQVIKPATDYIALNEDQIRRSSARVERTSRQLIIGLLVLGLAGGAAGVLTGYGAAQIIGQRLLKLSFPLREVAGRLDQVAGPIMVAMDPRVDDMEGVLERVAKRVSEVVEQLQQSQRDTLRSEQLAALGQLAAGLSHELRNPLTAIVAILGDADSAPDLDERDVAVLREEALRLESLVQSLLDFARPNDPKPRAVDLRESLDAIVRIVGPRAEKRGVILTVDQLLEGARVMADKGHFRQIVLNLLLNAVDASPKGGAVTIGVDGGVSSVNVTIRDEGVGIPKHLGDRVFEPFVSDKETGLGLGLSVSRRLAELNGGSLAAMSPGKGAVFTLRLPATAPSISPSRKMVQA